MNNLQLKMLLQAQLYIADIECCKAHCDPKLRLAIHGIESNRIRIKKLIDQVDEMINEDLINICTPQYLKETK